MSIDHTELSHLIHRCGHTVGHYHNNNCMNPSQIRILRILFEKGSQSQKELVCAMGIRPASLSEMITKLEAHQYIEKKKDEKDKRITLLYLTDLGKEYYLSASREHEEFVDYVLNTLEEDEKEVLYHSLSKIIDKAHEYFETSDSKK